MIRSTAGRDLGERVRRRRVGRCLGRGQLPGQAQRADSGAGRLADTLASTTRAYRTRLSVDLVLIGALLRLGETGTAAGTVEDDREALQGLAEGLHAALAAATRDRSG